MARSLHGPCRQLDHFGGSQQIGRKKIGHAVRSYEPLGFTARTKQDSAASGPVSGFYVIQDVANHERRRQVYAVLISGAVEQSWPRLAALAVNRVHPHGA